MAKTTNWLDPSDDDGPDDGEKLKGKMTMKRRCYAVEQPCQRDKWCVLMAARYVATMSW